MRFLRLRVANYRGIPLAEIAFAPSGITLVQGPNEIGKTSLGEAIGLLFEFPDSSRHRAVEAIRPVHRDEGPEIELQAESGPYAFTYFKRFYKKPETRLNIARPKPENHTGRDAHDRADAILRETLDLDLFKALTIEQGDAIRQPALGKQTSLSAALDKVAGGRPADPREEDLFSRVREEYARYYTERGAERKELAEARKLQADAQAEAACIAQAIGELEQDVEREAALQREAGQLRHREEELAKEVAAHAASLEEIGKLETALSVSRLRLEGTQKSQDMARRDVEARRDLIDAVAKAEKEHKGIEEAGAMAMATLSRAEEELRKAQAACKEADCSRREADALAALRRADFDYYNGKLHLDQLRERKERIDQARKDAGHAEDVLVRNKMNDRALEAILDAERTFLTANAQLLTGAPCLLLRGLADCRLLFDNQEIRLGMNEVRTISVAERCKLTIPGMFDMEITPGCSTEGLSGKLEAARQVLEDACAKAGVADPESARKAFEERREALRLSEAKRQVEKENLRDLSYEELERKVHGLGKGVPDYMAERIREPAVCPDLESAKQEWERVEAAKQKADGQWEAARETLEAARSIRDGINARHRETCIQRDLLARDLRQTRENLERARKAFSDDALAHNLAEAVRLAAAEEAAAGSAEESLKARHPERIRELAEAAKGSLQTTQSRRAEAQTALTEIQTRLKIHGEEGLHEKLQTAQSRLERVSHENRSLFQRAAVAGLLYDTMRDERDRARRAYVAPLKERIEALGRLVFDLTFQVDIDEDLQIANRTAGGVTVPFESLSGGTKEQLALIFRLACAMIVSQDGGTPVILDDALGYTDSERLRLMGAVLAKAARQCQILIFTCIPERYDHIGKAKVVSIS